LTALRGLAYDPAHESMSKISQNESNRLNLSRLVAAVFAVDFGSLWWTPDFLWQREILTFKPRDGGTHPGLCVRVGSPYSVCDPWPLLHGVSSPGPLKVVGLSSLEPTKPAYFGKVLRPGFFGAPDFVVRKGGDHDDSIRRNRFKPSLSEDEQTELRKFLEEKGIWNEP
jgi:hypothetical protein